MPDVVTFDPINLWVIEISTGGDNSLDLVEIYSEWKEWQSLSDNAKYPPAFRYVGADPISDVQNLGTTFFISGGWRIKPAELDHELELVGNIYIDGGGTKVTVPTTGAYTVQVTTRVSNLVDSSVARLDLSQLQEAIYIDTVNGNDSGGGTPTEPVQTISRAADLATENNLHAFSVLGTLVLDRSFTEWTFLGTVSPASATVDFNGWVQTQCKFREVTLTGDAASSDVTAVACLLDSVQTASGHFDNCGLAGFVTPGTLTKTTMHQCYSDVAGSAVPVVDLAPLNSDDFQLRAYAGGIELRNIDVVTQDVSVDLISGHLVLHSTCSDGTVVVRGVGHITDNSTGSTVIKTGFVEGGKLDDLHSIQVRDMVEDLIGVIRRYTSQDGSGRVIEVNTQTGARTAAGVRPA